MYLIINKTTRKTTTATGNWPAGILYDLLNSGNEIIVISTYSNTIKVPSKDHNDEWKWDDYSIPTY